MQDSKLPPAREPQSSPADLSAARIAELEKELHDSRVESGNHERRLFDCVDDSAKLEQELHGYKEAHADKQRLVRVIDEIISGKGNAAKQASLCDLVGPIKQLVEERDRLRQAAKYALDEVLWKVPAHYVDPRVAQRAFDEVKEALVHHEDKQGAPALEPSASPTTKLVDSSTSLVLEVATVEKVREALTEAKFLFAHGAGAVGDDENNRRNALEAKKLFRMLEEALALLPSAPPSSCPATPKTKEDK